MMDRATRFHTVRALIFSIGSYAMALTVLLFWWALPKWTSGKVAYSHQRLLSVDIRTPLKWARVDFQVLDDWDILLDVVLALETVGLVTSLMWLFRFRQRESHVR